MIFDASALFGAALTMLSVLVLSAGFLYRVRDKGKDPLATRIRYNRGSYMPRSTMMLIFGVALLFAGISLLL